MDPPTSTPSPRLEIGYVYCIYFPHSKRGYVGSAVDVLTRWRQHRCKLRQGKHHCKALQAEYDREGEVGMRYGVIDVLVDCSEDALAAREVHHMREVVKSRGRAALLNTSDRSYRMKDGQRVVYSLHDGG